jgi:hypothetical protein
MQQAGARLLETAQFLPELRAQLDSTDDLDVAVAWATSCDALKMLEAAANRGVRIRALVGLSFSQTEPDALRKLDSFASLKVVENQHGAGVFHPKVFLFRTRGGTVLWIGSANLTSGGFGSNSELMLRLENDTGGRIWFDKLWGSLPSDCSNIIDNYIANWRRPPPPSTPQFRQVASHPISLLSEPPKNWDDYIDALKSCDRYWRNQKYDFSVFGESWSYTNTILVGRSLAERSNWGGFEPTESKILLGADHETGAWGLLGSMAGAAKAISVFVRDSKLRRRIGEHLAEVIKADGEDDFVEAATAFIAFTSTINRFGTAIATRLLSLARPDRGISVNRGSAPGLSSLTGLPSTPRLLADRQNYSKLLRWLYVQPWYRSSRPEDSLGQQIWSMRAALIDSFVYDPV